jgi:choloylglycine hydrolase
MLTMARNPQSLTYYFRSYDDQTIRAVRMDAFDKNGKGVKMISTKSTQPIVDVTDRMK